MGERASVVHQAPRVAARSLRSRALNDFQLLAPVSSRRRVNQFAPAQTSGRESFNNNNNNGAEIAPAPRALPHSASGSVAEHPASQPAAQKHTRTLGSQLLCQPQVAPASILQFEHTERPPCPRACLEERERKKLQRKNEKLRLLELRRSCLVKCGSKLSNAVGFLARASERACRRLVALPRRPQQALLAKLVSRTARASPPLPFIALCNSTSTRSKLG